MDALTDILQSCRLQGTVFSQAWCQAPWAVRAEQLPHGVFHAVIEGGCYALPDLKGVAPIRLELGDVLFLPRGTAHVMCDAPGRAPEPIGARTRRVEDRSVAELRIDGPGPRTGLICGSLRFEAGQGHPLLEVLPPVLRVEAGAGLGPIVTLIRRELEAAEAGAETVIARLTDVLLVSALRAWLAQVPLGEAGWMSGLTDPGVARALGLMHRRPAEDWTVDALARRVGMSRSAFAARFVERVGESPGQYLLRWRMHLARQALRREPITLAEVAGRVGYSSEFAFSKAFKRVTGQSPDAWRREMRGSAFA